MYMHGLDIHARLVDNSDYIFLSQVGVCSFLDKNQRADHPKRNLASSGEAPGRLLKFNLEHGPRAPSS
jgi:hypothetical protein